MGDANLSNASHALDLFRFTIDFVSCVPIGYIFMILDAVDGADSDEAGNANKIKLTKILRLVRLAKNLARIARLKKLKTLMEEYEDYFEPIMYAHTLTMMLLICNTWLTGIAGGLKRCTVWQQDRNPSVQTVSGPVVSWPCHGMLLVLCRRQQPHASRRPGDPRLGHERRLGTGGRADHSILGLVLLFAN